MYRKGYLMDILVVTGGIGSGKSEVCRILQEEYGCGTYNADQSVKSLYDRHPSLLSDVESLAGESLRNDEGRFVPAKLASRIFADRNLLLGVEGLVFPALMEDFKDWMTKAPQRQFAVFESATILEKPQLDGFGDKVILVDAPVQTRLERACGRDAVARERIAERMNNQKLMNSISEGRSVADVDAVIMNSGTLDELKTETLKAIGKLYGNI